MAYLQITLKINEPDRAAASSVYTKYKQPFLDTIAGAAGKELLVRDEDLQVLHEFDTADNARPICPPTCSRKTSSVNSPRCCRPSPRSGCTTRSEIVCTAYGVVLRPIRSGAPRVRSEDRS